MTDEEKKQQRDKVRRYAQEHTHDELVALVVMMHRLAVGIREALDLVDPTHPTELPADSQMRRAKLEAFAIANLPVVSEINGRKLSIGGGQ